MAYDTGGLVARVQRRIRDTGYSTSEIKEYLNDTLNDIYNEYTLPFMEAAQSYTLAPNVADITNGAGLPSNYVQALDVYITSSGYEKLLEYQDVRQIDSLYPDPDDTTRHTPGVPNAWYFYADTIKVYPAPNSAYTISLRYYKKPTELSADGDVPELPSEFAEVLIMGAAYRVLQVKDNYDQAAILQNKYDELLQKLVVKYSVPQIGKPMLMRINRRAMGKAHF